MYTGASLGCEAQVLSYSVDSGDNTRLYLVLDRPIKADTGSDTVTLNYGDGTQQSASVVDVNMLTNVWHVDIGGTAFSDTISGLVSICVPTATDSTCPGCSLTLATATECT